MFQPTKIEMYLEGNDQPVIVLADGRDFAAWEAAPENDPERRQPTVMTRYVTWSAARRAGQVSVGWPEFNRKLCVLASVAAEPEKEEPEADDSDPLA